MIRQIGLSSRGNRVGEDHPRARLTDHEVDLLLRLRDRGWKYAMLMEKFELAKSTVRNICTGRCRCQRAERFKSVVIG